MRLNGWQRIGIVASVVWAIGAGAYAYTSKKQEAENTAQEAYSVCWDLHYGLDECQRQWDDAFHKSTQYLSADTAFMSAVPVMGGWIIAYGGIAVFQWVRRGFQKA